MTVTTKGIQAKDIAQVAEGADELWTSLNFLAPLPRYDYEKPYSMDCAPPPGVPRTNVESLPFNICIKNARGYEHTFASSPASFEWFKHELTYALENEESIDRYLREMEGVLKKRTGAKKVLAYDYVVRASPNRIFIGASLLA
jgi:hypothetical protein